MIFKQLCDGQSYVALHSFLHPVTLKLRFILAIRTVLNVLLKD